MVTKEVVRTAKEKKLLYKTLQIQNDFSEKETAAAAPIFLQAGLGFEDCGNFLSFKFDEVNLRLLEENEQIEPVKALTSELKKIRSFSTANGKIVYASFNKNKKVFDKEQKKKKRLAYESFQKNFPKEENPFPKNLLDKIHCENSLDFLKSLPENCVDIVLTSPPYNFGISYNSCADTDEWKKYFESLFEIFRECVRVLKSGGRIIVNVQPMFSDYIPTHHFVSKFFIDEGLIWKGEIIWEKNNYNCKYCTWGSWKSPAAPYLKYSWEFVEVFCKNTLKKEGCKNAADITADEFKKFVYAKWSIPPERRMKEFGHDAMFPEALVERCLKLFSFQGDIVLDPFNGAGTTTAVASQLGRHFVGIDIDEKYCETAKKRVRDEAGLFGCSIS